MCFKKIGRRNALAIARVNGACIVKISENTIHSIKLAIGAVASKPERFSSVEEYLRGKEVSDELLREAGSLASDYVLGKTGKRSSSDYKLPVTARFTASLIESALNEGEKADE